jgi:ketosteroid isomerase-like protein
MRFFLIISLLFTSWIAFAQKDKQEVLQRMRQFHESLVKDKSMVDQYLDDSLTYGHSNGWIETKAELMANLGTKIVYHAIKEDSVSVVINNKMAHARFIAVIDATMDGKPNQIRLKVMEVWRKEKKKWKLFARQAIRG